ncbi:hypothetical protein PENTCL1PPCAC_11308, partial [Pristionchus entomophagus]
RLTPFLLLLSLPFSNSHTLKHLDISTTPATTSHSPTGIIPNETAPTKFSTISVDQLTPPPSITVSHHTTESSIEQLLAFTHSSSSSAGEEVLEILQTSDNETMSVHEFDVSDNSTILTTTLAPIPKGMIRQCQCTETLACRVEARNETDNCFEQCDEQLGFLGNETLSYIECFETNQNGLSHAEDCLEGTLGSVCSASTTPRFLEARDHEEYVNTKFIQNKQPKKTRPLLHKTHHILAGFHEFYHCTKNCIHKRMMKCFRKKNCSIRLPSLPSFGEAMSNCAKNNISVSRSLRSTCQCLLHKKK